MAVTEQLMASLGGGAALGYFSYNDVDMDIVAVRAVNNDSTRKLYVVVTAPRSLSQTLLPGESFTLSLPAGQHIPYTDGLDYHGTMKHKGVDWSVTLGV